MKITKIVLQQKPVIAPDQSGLSKSNKRIINNGGYLYPNPKIDYFDPSPKSQFFNIVNSGEVISAPNANKVITESGTTLTESDKRILNGGGCLYPNRNRLDLNLKQPIRSENSSKSTPTGQQPASNSAGSNNQANSGIKLNSNTQNSVMATMPGDIAPVSGRSLTLGPPVVNTNPPAKPGAIVRSAFFLAGEVVGLGKAIGGGIADVGKFLYDVESAAIARGHDLIFEGTPNGSFTQVYQPTSSLGTASSEGRGGEAALKLLPKLRIGFVMHQFAPEY